MGKLALRGLESNLQVELCPSSRLSVSGHSSSRASPTGPESQPASPTHPTTLPSLQLVIEEKVQAIRFPEYLPYLHAYSVPRLSRLYTGDVRPLSSEANTPLGRSPYSCPFFFYSPLSTESPSPNHEGHLPVACSPFPMPLSASHMDTIPHLSLSDTHLPANFLLSFSSQHPSRKQVSPAFPACWHPPHQPPLF